MVFERHVVSRSRQNSISFDPEQLLVKGVGIRLESGKGHSSLWRNIVASDSAIFLFYLSPSLLSPLFFLEKRLILESHRKREKRKASSTFSSREPPVLTRMKIARLDGFR